MGRLMRRLGKKVKDLKLEDGDVIETKTLKRLYCKDGDYFCGNNERRHKKDMENWRAKKLKR